MGNYGLLLSIMLSLQFAKESHGVDEIRPHVAQELNLAWVQSFHPVIAFAAQALTILPLQQNVLQQRPTKFKQHQVGKNHAVTRIIARLILFTIDIGRDDAVEVSPSNDESKRDTAFVDAYTIISLTTIQEGN